MPLIDINQGKLVINDVNAMSGTNSRWTNRVIAHVINAMSLFSINFSDFINTGPQKFIPVYLKGPPSFVLNPGKTAISADTMTLQTFYINHNFLVPS